MDRYLYYGYIPAPQSIYEDVIKVPPGHFCVLKSPRDPLTFIPYWQWEFRPDPALSNGRWREGLKEKLNDAVGCHLISDVPIGAFLSGGIDSSAVVASMTKQTNQQVKAYTIGFSEPQFDERGVTRESARLLNVDYHEEQLQIDILDTLNHLIGKYGEPFADSSAICTYRVTEVASRDVKVMLSGDGGDEIFCGYSHYGWMLSEFTKSFNPIQQMKTSVGDILRKIGLRQGRMTIRDAWQGRNAYFKSHERASLWRPEFQTLIAENDSYLDQRFSRLNRVTLNQLIDTAQELDAGDYLPYNNLHKVDIASMCHGLEVRVPLLDHELAEYVAKIPWSERIRPLAANETDAGAMHGHLGKLPLRSLAEETFGAGYFSRKKQGFALPIGQWLASSEYVPVLREELLGSQSPLANYFDSSYLSALVARHTISQGEGLKLWSLLFLAKWLGVRDA